MNLLATDKGVPPKSNRTKITIQLQDVNDNPPQFISSIINISVEENKKSKEQVYSEVLATDPDYKENKQITYKWEFVGKHFFLLRKLKPVNSLKPIFLNFSK